MKQLPDQSWQGTSIEQSYSIGSCYLLVSDIKAKPRYQETVDVISNEVFEGIDAETFEAIDDQYYSDKNHVYYRFSYVYDLHLIEDADVTYFKVLGSDYSKDKNFIFFYDHKIEGVDPDTFQVLEYRYSLSKDKNRA